MPFDSSRTLVSWPWWLHRRGRRRPHKTHHLQALPQRAQRIHAPCCHPQPLTGVLLPGVCRWGHVGGRGAGARVPRPRPWRLHGPACPRCLALLGEQAHVVGHAWRWQLSLARALPLRLHRQTRIQEVGLPQRVQRFCTPAWD